MNIIDIIIDVIKDFNLYVYIGLDLAYLPFVINPKHLETHPPPRITYYTIQFKK